MAVAGLGRGERKGRERAVEEVGRGQKGVRRRKISAKFVESFSEE